MTTPVHAPTTPDELAEHRFFELSIDMLCFARFDGYFQHLNPAWTRDDEAPLYYELDGLVVGRSYAIEVEIWEGGAKAKSPETRVAFSLVATGVSHRGEQLVSFKQLKTGDYRLVLRVRDAVGGASVERSRSVAVR